MKLEIEGVVLEPEPVVKLSLEQYGNEVRVCARGADGKLWFLIGVTQSGLWRKCDVPEGLGLPIDGRGRVKLVGE